VVATVDAQLKRRPLVPSSEDPATPFVPDRYHPQAYLKNLLVDPSYRRQGIAAALVGAVRDYAVAEGASVVVLHVDRENVGAVRLYMGAGFRFDEEGEGGEEGRMVAWIE